MSIVRAYRESKGCERCGENHPAVLDLHHRDEGTKHDKLRAFKTQGGNIRLGRGWREVPLRDLDAELAKCEVLCANCHRKETYERKRQVVAVA
jgi:hypothetical protein